MGKTSVLELLDDGDHPSNVWLVLKADLELVHTWREFASVVFDQLSPHLDAKLTAGARMRDFLGGLGGLEIK